MEGPGLLFLCGTVRKEPEDARRDRKCEKERNTIPKASGANSGRPSTPREQGSGDLKISTSPKGQPGAGYGSELAL